MLRPSLCNKKKKSNIPPGGLGTGRSLTNSRQTQQLLRPLNKLEKQKRGEILKKSKDFLAYSVSTYDFSTLYITFPHNLIKEKLTESIE